MVRIRSYFSGLFFFFLFEAHSSKSSKGVEVSMFGDFLRFICGNSHTTLPKHLCESHSIGDIYFGLTYDFTKVGDEHLWEIKKDFINDMIHYDGEVPFRDIFQGSRLEKKYTTDNV